MNTLIDDIDYGPLAQLIGKWIGQKGLDIAPETDGSEENNPYIDELEFKAAGAAENAEQQQLVAVLYRHIVRKQENGLIFHDQIGHWIYEPATGLLMHSLTIPRGVCLLAGGEINKKDDEYHFNVKASAGSDTFGISQSPFMLDKAKTKAFEMNLRVKGDQMSYEETTSLHIYGKDFEHIDTSSLTRSKYDVD